MAFWVLLAVALAAPVMAPAAHALEVVPPGNRSATQPPIPGASVRRTKATKSTFDIKYEKVRDLIATDRKLRDKIKATARKYGIDPMHMVGALVGEHTYNVDAYDRLQSYYVKAIAYANSDFTFGYDGETVDRFIARPEFSICQSAQGSWQTWACREKIWDNEFRGRRKGGKSWPNDRFSAVFFQPFYAGQTFGLGQINPLTAIKLTDFVSRVSGYRKLDHRRAADVYKAIMDPDQSLAYMAASLRTAIDFYRQIAGFDISRNPGITATLYNVGNPDDRAAALAAKNRARAKKGQKRLWPEENYYGWLVNDKLDELSAYF